MPVLPEGLFYDTVAAAVAEAVQSKRTVVVYCTSDALKDDWIMSWLDVSNFQLLKTKAVWLRLLEGTDQFEYFKQIQPSVSVPTVTLLNNGEIGLIITKELDTSTNWKQLCDELNINIERKTTVVSLESKPKETIDESKIGEIPTERVIKPRVQENEGNAKKRRVVESKKEQSTEIKDNIKLPSSLVSNKCTLLIRLTNGKTITNVFNADDTLYTVRKWVDLNRTDGDKIYSFHRNVPRMTLTESDELKSLRDLLLLPRSALILKVLETSNSTINITHAQQPSFFNRAIAGITSWWNNEDTNLMPSSDFVQENKHLGEGMRESRDSPLLTDIEKNQTHTKTQNSKISNKGFSHTVYQLSQDNERNDSRTTFNGNNIELEDENDDKNI